MPPQVVARNQRERLLAAVIAEVGENGYQATSVADIVSRAGVSRAPFYRNFASRADCYDVACERLAVYLYEGVVEAARGRDGLESQLEAALALALDRFGSEPGFARVLTVEFLAGGPAAVPRWLRWQERFGSLLRAGAEGDPKARPLAPYVERALVGACSAVIAEQVMRGRAARLTDLALALQQILLLPHLDTEPAECSPIEVPSFLLPKSPLGEDWQPAAAEVAPARVEEIPQGPFVLDDIEALRDRDRFEKRNDRRRRIVAATSELLAKGGFAEASRDRVIERSGVGPRNLYELFGTVQEAREATYNEHAVRLLEAVDGPESGGDGFCAHVEAILRAALEFFAADPTAARVLAYGLASGGEPPAARYRAWREHLGSLLQRPAGEPGRPQISPLLGVAIVGALASLTCEFALRERVEQLPGLTPELFAVAQAALALSPAPEAAAGG